MRRLDRALKEPTDQPAWAGELRLALNNLQAASFQVVDPEGLVVEPSYSLPGKVQAEEWFENRGADELVIKAQVERFTALRLLVLLSEGEGFRKDEVIRALEGLLRHVEVRRKACLSLRRAENPMDRWYEVHDTAILFARTALRLGDLRYLNAAMKLNDWALRVHRRSVPADLLVRFVLSVSEVHRTYGVLL
jgi:hypothetical protein